MVGLSFVKTQIDNTLVEDAKAVETKIKSILPNDDLKRFMDSIGAKTIIDPYKRFGTEKRNGGDWFTIGNAISNSYKIAFVYISSEQAKQERRHVNPYLLVYYTDHWTLIGYCNSKEGIRSFRLDRMKNVEILPQSFDNKNIPDEKALLFRTNQDEQVIKIWVEHSAVQTFKSSVPAKIEHAEADEYGIQYSFKFDNIDFLNNWLFTFHDKIKVIAPDELSRLRIMKIQSMLRAIKG